MQLLGRNDGEAALRDAVLLTAPGDDPGPAGAMVLAFQRLAAKKRTIGSKVLQELAALIGLRRDGLDAVADLFDAALQSPRAVPFAIADLVASICAARPDAEILAWWLADRLLAEKLGWACGVPLLMTERYGAAFKTIGGRGRVRPGEPGFARAVCLALVSGTTEPLRQANEIGRRAETLLTVAPKLRTKGAGVVIQKLLDEDAVPAAAPGSHLSRWAATRLFERLESFGAVRELRPHLVPDLRVVMMAGPGVARRKARSQDEVLLDRELEDLPPDLRWREWMLRVEAVIFAAAEPVTRETLTRVVGKGCSIDLIIDDLREELRSRPYDIIAVAGGWQHRSRSAYASAIRASQTPTRSSPVSLSEREAAVLAAIAYLQPVTRGELSTMFGKEVSRDTIASLRDAGFLGSGPRSPTPGAPYTYVTTRHFLSAFGLETLRDLPDLERLEDAGLLSRQALGEGATAESESDSLEE